MRTETEWRTWMFSAARRWTYCDADAEDIVQDVLLRFWVAFGVLPWEHAESQWARVVCQRWIRFRAAELRRSARPQREVALDEQVLAAPCHGEGSETFLIERAEHLLLFQRLEQTLSPQQSQMLRLYLDGYTYEEIAVQRGVCVGTVKRQFARIREKMKPVWNTGPTETYKTTNPRTGRQETRVKWQGHVMFMYGIEKSPIRNQEGEVVDYFVDSLQLLESTGAPANKVRIQQRESRASSRGRQPQCVLRVLQDDRNGYEVRRIPDRRR